MRDYEIMLILPSEADESVVGTAVDRITKVIEAGDGKVGNVERWGKRRFAYEIDDKTEGYYVVVKFIAEPQTQLELERVLNLADEVVRFKVLAVRLAKLKRKNERAASPVSA